MLNRLARWRSYNRHLGRLMDAETAAGYRIHPAKYERMQAEARVLAEAAPPIRRADLNRLASVAANNTWAETGRKPGWLQRRALRRQARRNPPA